MKRLIRSILSVCVPLWTVVAMAADSASPPMVHQDWYFRESLPAISDWEAILAAWEKSLPESDRTPVFPVPAGGESAQWPNPIPQSLIPEADKGRSLTVRLAGEEIQIERTSNNGEVHRETAPAGATILGYQHPGGGGKDQWNHSYHRRFDRLTTFRAKPAPFSVQVVGTWDPGLGRNELKLQLENVSGKDLSLALELKLHTPREVSTAGEQSVTIAAGQQQTVRFAPRLSYPGGAMLVVRIDAQGDSYWLPLLMHVEDVPAVIGGVRKILADIPDAKAAAQVDLLATQTRDLLDSGQGDTKAAWRTLFAKASRWRDELLLQRVAFDTLLLLKRQPFFSEQPFMDAHHLFNRPGGGIYRLSPVRPDGELTAVVDSLGEGVYRDVHLHWNAEKFLFAFGNGSDKWDGRQSYHIYEAPIDGRAPRRLTPRQLTSGPKNDCEPLYLPGGQVGFTSDRSEHFVMCGGDRHSPTLFVMDADGANVRQLSFNVFNDFNPTLLPDGRILYSRWEYNERSVTSLHNPFTMRPDGTMVRPYYGNQTIRPNVIMFPRPVPGSHRSMALFTAHHGQTHGAVGLIDVRRGINGSKPLTLLTPNVPVTGEKPEDSRVGWYSDPVPLSETTYLCSYTPTVLPWLPKSWAIYVGDRHGNLALVYRDAKISCAEPVPLIPRPTPHVLPPADADTDAQDAEATLLLANVTIGLGDVSRDAAKYLRVLEDVPRKSVDHGGVICTTKTEIFTIKRVLGTVPIEPDGSAHFVVPANRNVYFEVLDADYREIQRMRSVICLKPGERRTCIGCHEPRNTAPPNLIARALRREPDRPKPPPWGTQTISYLRDVQPILNAKCVRCHTHGRESQRVVLTDDLTNQFAIGYEELIPYLKVAKSNIWDTPPDVYKRAPYSFGSKASPLVELLARGHHDVTLSDDQWQRLVSWVDANGVYYDRYETAHYSNRQIFDGPTRQGLEAVFNRRCVSCHGAGDGSHDSWWMSVNRRESKLSRALMAPLAQSAGGWGRCRPAVFADTDDADYKAMRASFGSLLARLRSHPRADLLSISGTPAEVQPVEIPAPPPPTKSAAEELPKGWVYLSDLKWKSGTAGWSVNQDNLPRPDKDAEDRPLRLAGRRYLKGVGTHAPSEIVYQLDGRYTRFRAKVGGAESRGSVVFQVFGDGKLLFDSGTMQGMRGVKTIDVSVESVGQLRLNVTDTGDGINSDMANWADARLERTRNETP